MKKLIPILLSLSFQFGNSQVTPAQFLADIDQLQELIKTEHVDPFWITSEEEFDKQVALSKEIISNKDSCDESCYMELFKIMASIKVGHSTISGGSRYEFFGYLPFTTRWFNGDLHVIKTAEKYEQILGKKITAVNGTNIDEVFRKLKTVLPHANESRFQKFVGYYLHLPGVLYGLGISEDPKKAILTFSDGVESFDLAIENMAPEEEETAVFISYLDGKDNLPFYQRDTDKYYWFEYDKNNELMYFQYNRVGNMRSESSSKFATRLWAAVDSLDINKFVLDLRYNGGGNFPYSLNYVQGILDRLDLSRRGTFFIITGYDTFSAAISMLNQLELKSQAIIVGEAPSDYPASAGDPEKFTLNNSQLNVNLSSLFHPTIFEEDNRTTTILDKEIVTKWQDYQNGNDPVMNYILEYSEEPLNMVPAEKFKEQLGKYSYSLTRKMELKSIDGNLWLEIDKAFSSPLYMTSEENTFDTEVKGVSISVEEGWITIQLPEGNTAGYEKIADDTVSAIDYIYKGELEKAELIYSEIQSKNADYIELKDHRMSFLASIAYFELRKYPDINASEIAKGILNLGIKLNDGDAPFCEFSLRFY